MELAGCWRSIEARSAVTHSDRRSSVETFFKSGIVRDVGAQRSGRVMRRRRSDRIFGVNGNLAKKHAHTHTQTHRTPQDGCARRLLQFFFFVKRLRGV
jgi:hypothetical protein